MIDCSWFFFANIKRICLTLVGLTDTQNKGKVQAARWSSMKETVDLHKLEKLFLNNCMFRGPEFKQMCHHFDQSMEENLQMKLAGCSGTTQVCHEQETAGTSVSPSTAKPVLRHRGLRACGPRKKSPKSNLLFRICKLLSTFFFYLTCGHLFAATMLVWKRALYIQEKSLKLLDILVWWYNLIYWECLQCISIYYMSYSEVLYLFCCVVRFLIP